MSNNKSRIAARKAGGWRGHGWGEWGSDKGFVPRVKNPPAVKSKSDRPGVTPIFGLKDSALAILKDFRSHLKK